MPEVEPSLHDRAGAPPLSAVLLSYPFERLAPDFLTGNRHFGAPRSGGRTHAGVDLLKRPGTPIYAIADGTVIQPAYYFYEGTYALEVEHPGVGVVRYGEIGPRDAVPAAERPPLLRAGDRVTLGMHIASVGRLNSGSSMLHFELYSGAARGPLTVRGGTPMQRRSDLQDPTPLIRRLERANFDHVGAALDAARTRER